MSEPPKPARRRDDHRPRWRGAHHATTDRGSDGAQWPATDDRERALRRLDGLARVLDSCVRIPFTRLRFGVDGVVGLVPVVGDAATAALSLYPVVEAWRLGFRVPTLVHMLGNVALDALVGAIPIVGDLFDIGFKANQRNVELLRRRLRDSAATNRHPPRA